MKKLVLIAVLLLGFSAMAMAQDVPMAEVFGGYSFFRCDAGDDVSCNFNGWNAAAAFNLNNNWSGVIDISGHYGWYGPTVVSVRGTNTYINWYDVKSHNILFGPRYNLRMEKFTPFAHALFGLNHVNPESYDSVQNNFAMAFGGGVDVNINDRISLRPAQLDYMTTRVVGADWSNNFRFSAGVVFKFGKR